MEVAMTESTLNFHFHFQGSKLHTTFLLHNFIIH